jgi:hypothetical protein
MEFAVIFESLAEWLLAACAVVINETLSQIIIFVVAEATKESFSLYKALLNGFHSIQRWK